MVERILHGGTSHFSEVPFAGVRVFPTVTWVENKDPQVEGLCEQCQL